MISNSSVSAISGGESWITGSPRSSARQISPRLKSSPDMKPRSSSSRLLVGEALLGLLVLDQLERVEVARAAHVADDRQVLAQLVEHAAELALLLAHVAAQVLALEDVEVRQRHRRRHRVAAERDAVRERVLALHERLGHAVGGDHRAHRRVRGGEALRRGDDVRHVRRSARRRSSGRAGPRSRSPRRRSAARRAGRRSRARAASSRPAARSSRPSSAPARGSPRRPSPGPGTRSCARSGRRPRAGRGPRASGSSFVFGTW